METRRALKAAAPGANNHFSRPIRGRTGTPDDAETERGAEEAYAACAMDGTTLDSGGSGRRTRDRRRDGRPSGTRHGRTDRRPEGAADLGRRQRAGLRRLEGRARPRRRALRHARRLHRPDQGRDADRRAPGRLRQRPRPLPGRDPRLRRPRPHGHQPGQDDQLPVGLHGRRVGDAGEVRAHVRHPPAERLHGAQPGARAQHRGRRDAGRRRGHADGRRQADVPLPQGPGRDRRRRSRRGRDLRLPGQAGQRGRLADAAGRAERHRVPRRLHAPGRRPRGAGHDRRVQPVPEPQPAAAPRDARLGHARRLPRLPAQLPRGAGRRPVPGRRRLGPGDAHDQLRPGRREPDDARRRRPGDRVEQGARAAPGLRVQRRRQRALQGPGRGHHRPARGEVRAARGQLGLRLHQPHLRAPEPRLLHDPVHRPPGHDQPDLGADPRHPGQQRGRAGHRRALRPGQHAAGQPRHDRPARLRHDHPGDRRSDRSRHVRLRADGELGGR